MAINRRDFVVSGSLLASSMFYGGLAGPANAATKIDELDFAFDAPVQWPVGEAIPTLEQYERQLDPITGPQNPFKSERIRAAELLVEMDKFAQGGKTPYQIARHFHDWRQGSVASDNETDRKDRKYFTREWPVRGNPLIMGLFDSTGLRTPVGDTTFWCAAFVSNCIHRSLVSRGNNQKLWPYSEGAASAAYRGFGKSVDDPNRGTSWFSRTMAKPGEAMSLRPRHRRKHDPGPRRQSGRAERIQWWRSQHKPVQPQLHTTEAAFVQKG